MHTNEAEPVERARSTYAAAGDLTLPAEYEAVEKNFAEFIRGKCLDDYVSDLHHIKWLSCNAARRRQHLTTERHPAKAFDLIRREAARLGAGP